VPEKIGPGRARYVNRIFLPSVNKLCESNILLVFCWFFALERFHNNDAFTHKIYILNLASYLRSDGNAGNTVVSEAGGVVVA